jgi:two-component system, cell cycle response regulator DivK
MEYNFTGKTILIVEDEKVSQYFFEKALGKSQANLLFVNNGLEAVEIIRKDNVIDLILMDIRLPQMNGIEATYKIKEINPKIPIIVQTAYALRSSQEEAIKSGCDEYITKPIRIETLLPLIGKYLNA